MRLSQRQHFSVGWLARGAAWSTHWRLQSVRRQRSATFESRTTQILIQYESGLRPSYFPVNDDPKSLVTIERLIICFYTLSLWLSRRVERHVFSTMCIPVQRRLSLESRRRCSTFDCSRRLRIACDNIGLIDVALGICAI